MLWLYIFSERRVVVFFVRALQPKYMWKIELLFFSKVIATIDLLMMFFKVEGISLFLFDEVMFQCAICCDTVEDASGIYQLQSCHCRFCREVRSCLGSSSRTLFSYSAHASIVLVKRTLRKNENMILPVHVHLRSSDQYESNARPGIVMVYYRPTRYSLAYFSKLICNLGLRFARFSLIGNSISTTSDCSIMVSSMFLSDDERSIPSQSI